MLGAPAPNLTDRPFTNLPVSRSPSANGLATTSITTRPKANDFTPSFVPWRLNGFGSFSAAGKIARLTTTPNTWTSLRNEARFLPRFTRNKNHKKLMDGNAQGTARGGVVAARQPLPLAKKWDARPRKGPTDFSLAF